MRPIGNSPLETTTLRLEQNKSFSFGIQILEEGRVPIDISDCTVRFATTAFQREAIHTTLGTVRIDLQAEDLQTPGSFPYVVTLVTSGGYASAIMKGTIDVLSNADLTLDEYSALTPPQNVEVRMRGTQVVQIAAAPQLPPAMTAARAARVDGRGHLILTMEDGNELDVGKVVGDPGPEGPPGGSAQTLYTWIKYADTPVTGMSNSPEGKVFRGVAYNKTSPDESTNYADYTWERIQGPPGPPGADGAPGIPGAHGQDGTQLYTWLKYADTPTSGMSESPEGKEYIGFAYNQTSPIESNLYEDYLWSRIQAHDGVPGEPGKNGQTYWAWVKYAQDPDGTGMTELPGPPYIGLAFNKTTPIESSNPADYQWTKILGDPGQDGVPGEPGADGQAYWTWVKYANGPNGEGMGELAGKPYIGLAFNKTTPVESSNPADYQWTKILGEDGHDGADGVPGAPGADGTEYWTWVKYADSAAGAGMSDSAAGKAFIGLAFNKTTPVESSNPADYQWTKILGEDGADGLPGAPGADGTEYWTWVKYADSAAGAGMSDSSTGKAFIGLAFNKTTPTESSNPADYQWTKILGEDGAQGVPGLPGADGQTMWTWVKYATGPNGENMSDSSDGKAYIGLAYNKNTPAESSNPADYQWSLFRGTSLASMTPYFWTQERNQTPPALPTTLNPPAGWQTTEPEFQLRWDLFRTERIVYDNGMFAYTAVSKVAGNFGASYVAGMAEASTHVGPDAPTEPGSPFAGQMWWVTNASNNFAGLRRYSGTVWQNYRIMADSIIAAKSISAPLLQAGLIEAEHLNVVAEAGGRYLSIRPDGLRLWDSSGDEDSPLVALTTSSEQFFTVSDGQGGALSSIDSAGGVTGRNVSADVELYYQGRSIEEYIRNYTPGVLAHDKRVVSGITVTSNTERRMGRMTVLVPAGRVIRASMRGPSMITNAGTELQAYFRVETGDAFNADGSPKAPPVATASSPWEGIRVQHLWGLGGTQKLEVDAATLIGPFSKPTYVSVMTCLWQASGGNAIQANASYSICEHLIEDVGEYAPGFGQFQYINATDVPATAPVQTYEKYYPSSSWCSYYGTGAQVASSSMYYNYVTQGQYGTATQGAARGLWTFPNMTSDLSGATISAAQIYIKNEHTRWGAGATAYLFTHGNTSVPTTLSASTTNQITQAFAKGQGVWIELPSSHFAGLKSGAIRGYGLYTTSSDDYGYWNKSAQIWIKYSK